MARSVKEGVSYYPLDVDWSRDIKVCGIIKKYNIYAMGVIPQLLARIYSDTGYYIVASDRFFKAMVYDSGLKVEEEKTIREIVNDLLDSGFFDKKIYEKFNILTSRGIQKRYVTMKRATAKPESVIQPEYMLLASPRVLANSCSKNLQESANCNNNPINEANCFQSKVNKNKKEKESKENTPLPPTGEKWADEEESFLEGNNSSDDEAIVETWNTVFPKGTPRHLPGGVMGLNPHYLANISKTIAEYPTNTSDGIAVYQRAFTALKESNFEWQLHSAIKLENFKILLTKAENAKKPRSSPGEASHRAPVHTREDYLADAQKYQGPKIRNKEVKDE